MRLLLGFDEALVGALDHDTVADEINSPLIKLPNPPCLGRLSRTLTCVPSGDRQVRSICVRLRNRSRSQR
jgi:hypothetical protein